MKYVEKLAREAWILASSSPRESAGAVLPDSAATGVAFATGHSLFGTGCSCKGREENTVLASGSADSSGFRRCQQQLSEVGCSKPSIHTGHLETRPWTRQGLRCRSHCQSSGTVTGTRKLQFQLNKPRPGPAARQTHDHRM